MRRWWEAVQYNNRLLIFVLFVFLGLLTVGSKVFAATITNSGAVNVNGTVYGPPPTTPAVITSPTSEQRFTSSPVTVSGTCGSNLIVKIFKNNIFAGSTACSDEGKFTISVYLLYGKTELRVRNYDFQDQAGPESDVMVVYYDVPPVATGPSSDNNNTTQAPLNTDKTNLAEQFIIKTDVTHQGVTPNVDFEWPIEIVGGTPPYAVSVNWGDGTSSLISRKDSGIFNLHHKYIKNGNYIITINIVDVLGRKTSMQLIAVASVPFGAVRPQPITLTKDYLKWIIGAAVLLLVGCIAYLVGRHKKGREAKS